MANVAYFELHAYGTKENLRRFKEILQETGNLRFPRLFEIYPETEKTTTIQENEEVVSILGDGAWNFDATFDLNSDESEKNWEKAHQKELAGTLPVSLEKAVKELDLRVELLMSDPPNLWVSFHRLDKDDIESNTYELEIDEYDIVDEEDEKFASSIGLQLNEFTNPVNSAREFLRLK